MATPVSIEVRDAGGRLLRNAAVLMRGVPAYLLYSGGYPAEVLVARPGTTDPRQFDSEVRDTTDARGRVSVAVRLGPRAPQGRLAVMVLGSRGGVAFQDTVVLTVMPGAPVAARMLPKDTTVYVDGTLRLRGAVVDRRGNSRSEPVTYEAGSSLTVNGDGVVRPSAYARSHVVVRSAFGDDTGYVSVVPHGRVLAVMATDGGGPFVLADLDGSRMTTIPALRGGFDAAPAWAPDGQHFIYSTFSLSREAGGELFVADTTGAAVRLFPTGTFRNAAYPRYSSDGRWIYFSGQGQDAIFALWRVHPDGSGAERLGTNFGGAGVDWRPDPSPDGRQIVFTTRGSTAPSGWGARTFSLGAAQPSSWIVPGLTARWSPTGERIAAMPDGEGPLLVVDADGTNRRSVTAGDAMFGRQAYSQPFDWSPDGQWLVVSHDYRLELLQVDTGLLLPLAWSSFFGQPAWQR